MFHSAQRAWKACFQVEDDDQHGVHALESFRTPCDCDSVEAILQAALGHDPLKLGLDSGREAKFNHFRFHTDMVALSQHHETLRQRHPCLYLISRLAQVGHTDRRQLRPQEEG